MPFLSHQILSTKIDQEAPALYDRIAGLASIQDPVTKSTESKSSEQSIPS